MKKIIIIFLFLVSSKCFAQQGVEDVLSAKSSFASPLAGSSDYYPYKHSILYYNDKVIMMDILGFKKSPFYFKIFNKKYDRINKEWDIWCYSNEMIKLHPDSLDLKKQTPDLYIELNYNSKENGIPFVNVICKFFRQSLIMSFSNAHSTPSLIPNYRTKAKKIPDSN